jgi:hypothetical protein
MLFIEGSGRAFSTIAPNDFSCWETVNEVVQQEPAEAGEPEIMGLIAAVGIVKEKPSTRDDRMRKILRDVARWAAATRLRPLSSRGHDEHARTTQLTTTTRPTRSAPLAIRPMRDPVRRSADCFYSALPPGSRAGGGQ